jgi:hypothetical protein
VGRPGHFAGPAPPFCSPQRSAELATDLGAYAGQVYDYHASHPQLIRLMQFEGLRSGEEPVPAEAERTAYYGRKVQALADAQRAGTLPDRDDPAYLIYAVVALTVWWFSVPQIIRMLTAGSTRDSPEARRAALVDMVRRLTAPAEHGG